MSGQAAVELLAYAAFFLLIFVSSVAVFSQQQAQGLVRAESAYAQQTLLQRKQGHKVVQEWISGNDMNHLLRMQLACDVAKTRQHARDIAVERYVPA